MALFLCWANLNSIHKSLHSNGNFPKKYYRDLPSIFFWVLVSKKKYKKNYRDLSSHFLLVSIGDDTAPARDPDLSETCLCPCLKPGFQGAPIRCIFWTADFLPALLLTQFQNTQPICKAQRKKTLSKTFLGNCAARIFLGGTLEVGKMSLLILSGKAD